MTYKGKHRNNTLDYGNRFLLWDGAREAVEDATENRIGCFGGTCTVVGS